ncbi:hypothetical protein [Streptomyces parvus]|uniref:hypothetical protein n=1 Tax=Streptomyces parvus TaxID=66428 RepID=UPI00362A1D37
MAELFVDAFHVECRRHPAYVAATKVPRGSDRGWLAAFVARVAAIPPADLEVSGVPDEPGADTELSRTVLAALGPADGQPLFLVRPGPTLDAKVAALAELVHHVGWDGEDLGVTHLVPPMVPAALEFVSWAMPDPVVGATVLVVDEAPVRLRTDPAVPSALGLRLNGVAGPLRVAEYGRDGVPAAPRAARVLHGPGIHSPWSALRTVLEEGSMPAGETVLLDSGAPGDWLLLEATGAPVARRPHRVGTEAAVR